MKSVTGVRDGMHVYVSNSTISIGQLAYYRERESRESLLRVSSPDTKGDDRQPSRELAIVCVCVTSAVTHVTIKAYAVGRACRIHQRVLVVSNSISRQG